MSQSLIQSQRLEKSLYQETSSKKCSSKRTKLILFFILTPMIVAMFGVLIYLQFRPKTVPHHVPTIKDSFIYNFTTFGVADWTGGQKPHPINKSTEVRFTSINVNDSTIEWVGIIQKMAYFNETSQVYVIDEFFDLDNNNDTQNSGNETDTTQSPNQTPLFTFLVDRQTRIFSNLKHSPNIDESILENIPTVIKLFLPRAEDDTGFLQSTLTVNESIIEDQNNQSLKFFSRMTKDHPKIFNGFVSVENQGQENYTFVDQMLVQVKRKEYLYFGVKRQNALNQGEGVVNLTLETTENTTGKILNFGQLDDEKYQSLLGVTYKISLIAYNLTNQTSFDSLQHNNDAIHQEDCQDFYDETKHIKNHTCYIKQFANPNFLGRWIPIGVRVDVYSNFPQNFSTFLTQHYNTTYMNPQTYFYIGSHRSQLYNKKYIVSQNVSYQDNYPVFRYPESFRLNVPIGGVQFTITHTFTHKLNHNATAIKTFVNVEQDDFYEENIDPFDLEGILRGQYASKVTNDTFLKVFFDMNPAHSISYDFQAGARIDVYMVGVGVQLGGTQWRSGFHLNIGWNYSYFIVNQTQKSFFWYSAYGQTEFAQASFDLYWTHPEIRTACKRVGFCWWRNHCKYWNICWPQIFRYDRDDIHHWDTRHWIDHKTVYEEKVQPFNVSSTPCTQNWWFI